MLRVFFRETGLELLLLIVLPRKKINLMAERNLAPQGVIRPTSLTAFFSSLFSWLLGASEARINYRKVETYEIPGMPVLNTSMPQRTFSEDSRVLNVALRRANGR